jgi:hypothetical protein
LVPESFDAFFGGSSAASGALIGLLFVAVTLRPDSIFGEKAAQKGVAMAGSAFTALVNAFFLSLSALLPRVGFGWWASALALVSLYSTWTLNRRVTMPGSQRVILLVSVVVYLGELVNGVLLIMRPHDTAIVYNLTDSIIAAFAVALFRAWGLIQGRHTEDERVVDPG